MGKFSDFKTNGDELIELPPGFRFHPTDEELISHYLSPKVLDRSFSTIAIGEVDLNKVEPWDLPWKAKMGEKEWYFFCVRDRKYPTGLRTNRATDAGYWKATGKDKEIFRAKFLVGMKKTLVFYRGRAPKGEKTNWVMHEYRLDDKHSSHNLPKNAKNEWVISRIFKKTSGGKPVHISGLVRGENCSDDSFTSGLPQLMDFSSDKNNIDTTIAAEGSHVTCFSNPIEDTRDTSLDDFSFSSSRNCVFSPFPYMFPKVCAPDSVFPSPNNPDSVLTQDQSILRLLRDNNVTNMKQHVKAKFSEDMSSALSYYDDQEFPIISSDPVDLDCLWNY
ncbi:hypothetical protein DH2020_036976 [Rehmannia glutinosa]|uniref:NAC domain-containing protein n=1 Tax=Rehmannia glutinosa TaxID=99300 RepID=A0ABR0V586_REHGL